MAEMFPWYGIGGAGGRPSSTRRQMLRDETEADPVGELTFATDDWFLKTYQRNHPGLDRGWGATHVIDERGRRYEIDTQTNLQQTDEGRWIETTTHLFHGHEIWQGQQEDRGSEWRRMANFLVSAPGLVGTVVGYALPNVMDWATSAGVGVLTGIAGYLSPAGSWVRNFSIGYGIGSGIALGEDVYRWWEDMEWPTADELAEKLHKIGKGDDPDDPSDDALWHKVGRLVAEKAFDNPKAKGEDGPLPPEFQPQFQPIWDE